MKVTDELLIGAASAAREQAYAPFSGYRVGAAILDENDRVHTGCNVENASFPCSSCAEAGAIGAMVVAGGRRVLAVAVVGGRDSLEECTPCGNCRQRLCEFADEDTRVLLLDAAGRITRFSTEELLPGRFRLQGKP